MTKWSGELWSIVACGRRVAWRDAGCALGWSEVAGDQTAPSQTASEGAALLLERAASVRGGRDVAIDNKINDCNCDAERDGKEA